METLISIVVAVYNAEKYISRCLDSLLGQTYKDIEIICVNDASTDKSQQVIDSFTQKDRRVRSIVHQHNLNAGGAMNDGIKASKGEYVCIVDNDDWLAPDAIENLTRETENNYYDIVTCDWYAYKSESNFMIKTNLSNSLDKEENINYSLINGYRLLGALIRRSIFRDNNLYFPERVFYEDNAIATCILCYANSIKPVHKPYYYYFLSEGSVTRSTSISKIVDRIYTTDLFLNNLQERGFVNDNNLEYVNYRYLCYSYSSLRLLSYAKDKGTLKQAKRVAGKIKDKMPNSLILIHRPEILNPLRYPVFYFLKEELISSLKRGLPSVVKDCIKRS